MLLSSARPMEKSPSRTGGRVGLIPTYLALAPRTSPWPQVRNTLAHHPSTGVYTTCLPLAYTGCHPIQLMSGSEGILSSSYPSDAIPGCHTPQIPNNLIRWRNLNTSQ